MDAMRSLRLLSILTLLILAAPAPRPAQAQWGPPCIGITPLKPIGMCPYGTQWVLTCVGGQWVWQCGR
jgi:hypothetical protein